MRRSCTARQAIAKQSAERGNFEASGGRCGGLRAVPRAWDEQCGFYKWRAKFGGMDASLIAEMRDLAEQNRRLKKMYAEMSMQNDLSKEALGKKR